MSWLSVIKIIWLFVIACVSVLGALTAAEYKGDVCIYMVFTVLSLAVLFFGFGPKAIFFDAFIGVLVWIGFWLKFSVQTAFFEGRFNIPVGAFDGSPHSLDQALLTICCTLAAILVARFIRQYFFSYPGSLPDIAYTGLYAFYRRYRSFVIVAFILAILAVCISNARFGFYQRGLVSRVILPFGLNSVYAWLLMFGLASVSAVVLRFEFELNRDRYWIAITIGLLETALSNISLWSRGMILNGSSLLDGAVAQFHRKEPRLRVGLTTFVIVAFLFFFAVSVVTVNYLRAQTFYGGYSQRERKEAVVEQTSVLFLDRWVGIERLMSVVGAPDKSRSVFQEALVERFDKGSNSFYDKSFIESPCDNSS